MLTFTYNCVDDLNNNKNYFSNIVNQIEEGFFLSSLREISFNNHLIQYFKTNLTIEAELEVPKDTYLFIFTLSYNSQILDFNYLELNSLVVLEPKTKINTIIKGNSNLVYLQVPKKIIEKKTTSLKLGVYQTNNIRLKDEIKYICLILFSTNSISKSILEFYTNLLINKFDILLLNLNPQDNKKYQKICETIKYMRENICDKDEISFISKKLKINERTLRGLFQEYLGVNMKQYQKSLIINKFKGHLLTNSSKSISELLKDYSMYSQSIMIKYFKSIYQTTPKKYLNKESYKNCILNSTENNIKSIPNVSWSNYIGYWELDLINNKLTWSTKVYEIFGLDSNTNLTYELFLNYVHSDDLKKVHFAYQNSLKDKKVYTVKHRIVRPDGIINHVEEYCRHEFNKEDKVIKSFGIVMRIDEL